MKHKITFRVEFLTTDAGAGDAGDFTDLINLMNATVAGHAAASASMRSNYQVAEAECDSLLTRWNLPSDFFCAGNILEAAELLRDNTLISDGGMAETTLERVNAVLRAAGVKIIENEQR